jgi:spermidine synthase
VRRYDAIFVDAYRQPYIPFYLTTREFFRLVRARLNPGGAVVVNVGHPEDSDALERVLTAGLRSAFRHASAYDYNEVSTLLAVARAAARLHRYRRPARTRGARRAGLHGRPRAGRVADRPLDRLLRGR